MNKKSLSERDICTKFITPAIKNAGWNIQAQVREEFSFTDGRIYVRGHLTARGKRKRADYILYHIESQITKPRQDTEMLMQAVLKEAFER